MTVFDKNQILMSAREATLKLLSQTENLAREINLEQSIRAKFNSQLQELKYSAEKMELTLSVVGTMKAGKSTLINSIIGCEVFPSRGLAMTVIPTYIKHEPNISGVRYEFKHAAEFSDLLKDLKNDGSKPIVPKSAIEKRMAEENYELHQELVELESICEELEVINDICRFYFDDEKYQSQLNSMFKNRDDFPTLSTKFKAIENIVTGYGFGSFIIVDTPGVNEAKLPILREVVDDQIARSAALMLVLNYTDLGSEADHSMRVRIQEEASKYSDRLIIAVNRFDERNSKTMQEVETIKFVREQLLQEIDLKDGYIFPISAKNALLSSQVLEHLKTIGAFTLETLTDWQEDFLAKILGGEWDASSEYALNKMANLQDNLEFAENMYKSSKIAPFVKTAITRAYQNLGPDTLISSLTKLQPLISELLIQTIDSDIDASKQSLQKLSERVQKLEKALEDLKNFMSYTKHILETWRECCLVRFSDKIKSRVDSIGDNDLIFEIKSKESFFDRDIRETLYRKNKSNESPEKVQQDFDNKIKLIIKDIEFSLSKDFTSEIEKITHEVRTAIYKFADYVDKDVLKEMNLSSASKLPKIDFDINRFQTNEFYEKRVYEKEIDRHIFGFNISWLPVLGKAKVEVEKTEFNKVSYLNNLNDGLNHALEKQLGFIENELEKITLSFGGKVEEIFKIVKYSSEQTINNEAIKRREQEIIESLLQSKKYNLDNIIMSSQEIVAGLNLEKSN